MQIITQIVFLIVLVAGILFFARNIRRVIRNVKLGKKIDRNDQPGERFAKMARIALGQSKMVKKASCRFLPYYSLPRIYNYKYRSSRNHYRWNFWNSPNLVVFRKGL